MESRWLRRQRKLCPLRLARILLFLGCRLLQSLLSPKLLPAKRHETPECLMASTGTCSVVGRERGVAFGLRNLPPAPLFILALRREMLMGLVRFSRTPSFFAQAIRFVRRWPFRDSRGRKFAQSLA